MFILPSFSKMYQTLMNGTVHIIFIQILEAANIGSMLSIGGLLLSRRTKIKIFKLQQKICFHLRCFPLHLMGPVWHKFPGKVINAKYNFIKRNELSLTSSLSITNDILKLSPSCKVTDLLLSLWVCFTIPKQIVNTWPIEATSLKFIGHLSLLKKQEEHVVRI